VKGVQVPLKIGAVDPLLAHTYLLVCIRTDSGVVGWGQFLTKCPFRPMGQR
jgi:L-alanine-DL-glutamate epimerase-like enolase superfamily enzyme